MTFFRGPNVWYVERCSRCFRENIATVVASGKCSWCGWTPSWTTYDGREIPLSELTDSHIYNIIKFFFALNRVPTIVLEEAKARGLLTMISNRIPAQKGYKSPAEIAVRDNEEGSVGTNE